MRDQIFAIIMVLISTAAFGQRTVSIPFSDGTTKIQADIYGSGDRAIVLAHGGRFNKESWSEQAKTLADAGFRVVAVQFRGDTHNPDGTPSAEGSAEDNASGCFGCSGLLPPDGREVGISDRRQFWRRCCG